MPDLRLSFFYSRCDPPVLDHLSDRVDAGFNGFLCHLHPSVSKVLLMRKGSVLEGLQDTSSSYGLLRAFAQDGCPFIADRGTALVARCWLAK